MTNNYKMCPCGNKVNLLETKIKVNKFSHNTIVLWFNCSCGSTLIKVLKNADNAQIKLNAHAHESTSLDMPKKKVG